MRIKHLLLLITTTVYFFSAGIHIVAQPLPTSSTNFIGYIVNPQTQEFKLYWKNDKQKNFSSIGHLKSWLLQRHKQLIFAMNAGMYKEDGSPLGLYIEDGKTINNLNRANATGNFYLKPNGVFYITIDNTAVICKTENFRNSNKIKYATQSGPMLVSEGNIHPAFKQGSSNLNIRNGIGILPGNKIIFAMSKSEISFYDFALYFKNMGCKNALYLDGFVSRTYLPEQNWLQTDGDFGVMIGVTKSNE